MTLLGETEDLNLSDEQYLCLT